MYHAYALLTPDSDLTLPAVASKLKARFPEVGIQQTDSDIRLNQGNWDYELIYQKGADVLTESEGLAGHIAGLDSDSPLRTCDRRLDVSSDTPDPFLEYMDNHFQVLEVLRGFKGVILVDPAGPELL